jgi:hypothetical protein
MTRGLYADALARGVYRWLAARDRIAVILIAIARIRVIDERRHCRPPVASRR